MSQYLNSTTVNALRRSRRCQTDGEARGEAEYHEFLHLDLPTVDTQSNRAAAHIVPQNERLEPVQKSRLERAFASMALRPVQPTKSTIVPRRTIPARSSASQLVSRMQPCDSVLPIFSGDGVP